MFWSFGFSSLQGVESLVLGFGDVGVEQVFF